MLVLGRKQGEKIVIRTSRGATICVSVARISRDYVRLGIDAPADVEIVRSELQGPQMPCIAKPIVKRGIKT